MRAAFVFGPETFLRQVPDLATPSGPLRTNNVAEYHGLIWLLERIRNDPGRRETSFRIHGDSQLVIRQMKGAYRVRETHLMSLHDRASKLAADLSIEWQWIPRRENKAGHLLE